MSGDTTTWTLSDHLAKRGRWTLADHIARRQAIRAALTIGEAVVIAQDRQTSTGSPEIFQPSTGH